MLDETSNTTDAQNAPEPIVDESPALPEFSDDTMPRFRSFAHELPSARFRMKARMMSLLKLMPEEWQNAQGDGYEIDVNGIDFDDLAELIFEAEAFAIDMARDPEAMKDWLVEQPNGEEAVFKAMGAAMESLGK